MIVVSSGSRLVVGVVVVAIVVLVVEVRNVVIVAGVEVLVL